ncbi:hypothetical protein B0J14DRAFT_583839 [Halenospora varia]|nr:hypothetical protein B0J14DRAFT_583839 [Halenospora varia]
MSTKPIRRITLFKVPKPEDQQALLDKYRTMPETAVKNGSPYILSVSAGPAFADQRSQGYTVAVVSVFTSKEDMVYYDDECEAHKSLKAVAKSVHQGAMMVYFESIFD